MDIFPALEAVRLQAAEATEGNQWQRLVRGGIVETLCQALLDIPSFQDPSVSAHEENTGVLSSWYPALRVLSESSMDLSQSLSSATTKLFISTVKKNWTAITIRLWTDPQQSLDGIEYMERTMFAALTRSMLNADPSFLSIIDRENDLTISLLARYWVLSTADSDFITTVATIMDIIDPSPDTSLALYRRSHPKPPAATARILQSTKSSASLFFTGVSNLYGWINRTQCGFAVRAVFAITSNAAEASPNPSPAFFKPLLCHKVFWKSILGVLKVVGDEDTADASGHQPFDSDSDAIASAADKEVRDLVFMNIFRLLGLVLETGCAHFPKETSDFVKLLVRAKLFDVLDEVLPQIKQMPKVAASVGNLFSEFSAALEKDPSLRPVLHSQFPRARTLRTLLDIAHGPLPNGLADHTPTFINSRNMTRRDAAATGWMMMHALEKKVKPQKECSRRGCSKRREAKCKDCAEAGYCGPECQKLDWMDHRLICGFKAINTREPGAFAYITYPKRFLDDTPAGDEDGTSQSTSTPDKPRELVTSRDLSDHVKKMRLEHEERAKELQRLEEESQALIDAGMANTYECAEEARRAEEDPNWTEELQREMERKQRERNEEWMARCARLHEDEAAMKAWSDALIALAPDDSNGKDPMKSLLQQLANSRMGS